MFANTTKLPVRLIHVSTWLIAAMSLSIGTVAIADITVPASTAYCDPMNGARVNDRGVQWWNDTATRVIWYGQFKEIGSLRANVMLSSRNAEPLKMKLTIDGQSVIAESDATKPGDEIMLEFDAVTLSKPGYHAITLSSETNTFACDVVSLKLSGDAVDGCHFNLKPRRNAASVHLSYPIKKDEQVTAFYCEMTGQEDPLWTYYMACGWHRGYFGMQVNSPTERRIIFSVWDSGGEAIDRDKVGQENRVTLIDKGDGVYTGDFGNEGTGGHSHLKHYWKTDDKQRFLVTAKRVDETHTVFAGHYFHPDSKRWMLISSWRAPKEGKLLRGLYSFSENFVGTNGNVFRKALYGNQWIRNEAGEWTEITQAKFSHDVTGRADRLDRFMGMENGQFYLAHGGFRDGFTEMGTPFNRPTANASPAEELEPLVRLWMDTTDGNTP